VIVQVIWHFYTYMKLSNKDNSKIKKKKEECMMNIITHCAVLFIHGYNMATAFHAFLHAFPAMMGYTHIL